MGKGLIGMCNSRVCKIEGERESRLVKRESTSELFTVKKENTIGSLIKGRIFRRGHVEPSWHRSVHQGDKRKGVMCQHILSSVSQRSKFVCSTVQYFSLFKIVLTSSLNQLVVPHSNTVKLLLCLLAEVFLPLEFRIPSSINSKVVK